MHRTYLLLGGNIGDREKHLSFAREQIEIRAGKILESSSVYETAPWGVSNQEDYLNQAVLIETTLSPDDLFAALKKIEMATGRTDQKKYAPRTLDIDILFYDNDVINSSQLTIPHPKIQLRRFVLAPLNEIAGGFIHPVLKKPVAELLKNCDDPLAVKKLNRQ